MAKNLLNKYVWLVDTIYRAGKITYEEISRRWQDNDLSEGKPLPIRTFHKWRAAIEEMFGLVIENEKGGQYYYYIENTDELKKPGSMRSWLFNTLTVSNLMLDSMSIKNKILFEEIPDGEQYLPLILKALKKNQVLEMTYQSYWRDEANTFEVEPYCLKAFKQRWYLVARSPYYDKIMIYSLDRVHQLEPTEETFAYPKDFNGEDYFEDCFGIIADYHYDVDTVKLKVSAGQSNYLRSLTLHQTQREIKRTDEYSIFTVRLRPTFDFQQEILSMGSDVEVLAPDWFREDTADRVKAMWDKYKEDKCLFCWCGDCEGWRDCGYVLLPDTAGAELLQLLVYAGAWPDASRYGGGPSVPRGMEADRAIDRRSAPRGPQQSLR